MKGQILGGRKSGSEYPIMDSRLLDGGGALVLVRHRRAVTQLLINDVERIWQRSTDDDGAGVWDDVISGACLVYRTDCAYTRPVIQSVDSRVAEQANAPTGQFAHDGKFGLDSVDFVYTKKPCVLRRAKKIVTSVSRVLILFDLWAVRPN